MTVIKNPVKKSIPWLNRAFVKRSGRHHFKGFFKAAFFKRFVCKKGAAAAAPFT
jgi:hypothetical protein